MFLEHASPAQVKLLDFGIAWPGARSRITPDRSVDRDARLRDARAGPEHGRGRRSRGVFALGCVLFECLAGEPSFRGDNLMSVLAKILCDEPPRLSALRDDVPEEVAALCGWMLAKDPARRPLDDDRAAALLDTLAPNHAGAAPAIAPIAIDALVAGLFDARFEVREHADRFFLVDEREIVAGGRTLLGKPTSCIGRDGELRSLQAMFEECVEEPTARAVLVTAPPGVQVPARAGVPAPDPLDMFVPAAGLLWNRSR